jgi:hypothetical protein
MLQKPFVSNVLTMYGKAYGKAIKLAGIIYRICKVKTLVDSLGSSYVKFISNETERFLIVVQSN